MIETTMTGMRMRMGMRKMTIMRMVMMIRTMARKKKRIMVVVVVVVIMMMKEQMGMELTMFSRSIFNFLTGSMEQRRCTER